MTYDEAKAKREHFEKYDALAQEMGVEALIRLVPAGVATIRRALAAGDEHLNTIALVKWDRVTGYIGWPRDVFAPAPFFREFMARHKRSLSSAECTCVLKHVAVEYMAKEAEAEERLQAEQLKLERFMRSLLPE